MEEKTTSEATSLFWGPLVCMIAAYLYLTGGLWRCIVARPCQDGHGRDGHCTSFCPTTMPVVEKWLSCARV